MSARGATLRFAWLAAAVAACGLSPGSVSTDASTSIAVAGHTLEPRTTVMFSGAGAYEETVVLVTDHPSACAEIPRLDPCGPESDLYARRIIDPPASVNTALVLAVDATAPGTYVIGAACRVAATASARAAFVVHSDGREVLRDEGFDGTVVLDSIERGVRASGSYRLVLASGAEIAGRFSGTFCAAMTAFASTPPNRVCTSSKSPAGDVVSETCSCSGRTVASTCTQQAGAATWACDCADAQGAASSCMQALIVPDCAGRLFTCCPMRF